MNIFFAPQILLTGELPEEESLHAVKVLRLNEGEKIIITDGAGMFYTGLITRAHHKRCAVEIIERYSDSNRRDYKIHIAVAPTKNIDRIEWFVEKATEIGIDEITMLKCRYSERKDVKVERLNKILISAMKQSLKDFLPKLNEMTEFKQLVTSEFRGQKFIAHCYMDAEKVLLKQRYLPGKNVLILIGPEGDFSNEEVELALNNSFLPVSLGTSRLRTETAALVACHTINLINE